MMVYSPQIPRRSLIASACRSWAGLAGDSEASLSTFCSVMAWIVGNHPKLTSGSETNIGYNYGFGYAEDAG